MKDKEMYSFYLIRKGSITKEVLGSRYVSRPKQTREYKKLINMLETLDFVESVGYEQIDILLK